MNIQKFDKLLKGKTSGGLNTFDEISATIIGLIKIKVDSNQNELMQRVSDNIDFNSTDDLQNFLNEYFEFNNKLIAEFDRIDSIENDDIYDVEIKKLVKNIFSIIPLKQLQNSFLDFIIKMILTVMSEYPIKLVESNEDNLKNLTKIFGNKDIAIMFVTINLITTFLSENKNIKYDELVDMGNSIFTFCMAMNHLRKVDFVNTQNRQNSLVSSANSMDYNVGRNDPCPCGSGRKYKKCCLNKNKSALSNSIKFEEPKDVLAPLSKDELHELYTIWSRFLNFVSKAFAGASGEEYIKIYDKNSKGEYFLTDGAIKGSRHYLTIRNFLNEYFFMLLEHFIDDNRVSQKNIDILMDIRDSYKYSRYYCFEMFNNGNAIFYNLDAKSCFYAHKTFYNYSTVFPKNKMFETMFFSYKGRIISDGVATQSKVELGDNIENMMKDDYKEDRKNLLFSLDINEPPKRNVYQLKISIKGAKPPIWRRISLKPNTTFYGLHNIIQSVFDWEDYHMFMFYGKDKNYTDGEMISEGSFGDANESEASKYRIDSELKSVKDKIKYIYDFGDSWEHVIELEKILPLDTTISYPTCTGGKRRGPLEDSGGIYNYNNIVDAIENPTFENQYVLGEEEEQYYEDINPKEFNKELANIILKREY